MVKNFKYMKILTKKLLDKDIHIGLENFSHSIGKSLNGYGVWTSGFGVDPYLLCEFSDIYKIIDILIEYFEEIE